ncbi:MAG: superoxide dismutase family protein [Polyangiales bacterium]
MRVKILCSLFLAASIASCARAPSPMQATSGRLGDGEERVATLPSATASIEPKSGSGVIGTVQFRQLLDTVEVKFTLEGLSPDSVHAIHIHTNGDCSAEDASSAGGHYNPKSLRHGLPPASNRHPGDLGNFETDGNGKLLLTTEFESFRLEGDDSVIGRAVIVHEGLDTGEQPSGAAGARIACGVILGDTRE